MSKHLKEVRRERRKVERRRRLPLGKHGAAALAAAAAIAAGTSAYASPVRFDNPAGEGHFQWPVAGAYTWLDLTLDAGSQGAIGGASAFAHYPDWNGYLTTLSEGGEVCRNGVILEAFAAGELIDATVGWGPYAFTDLSGYGYQPGPLPEESAAYLGVRFPLTDGTHYGWVGVIRTTASQGPPAYIELEAFAWGYNDEPGQPIAAGAPEPGTLAMLALGALGVTRRRR